MRINHNEIKSASVGSFGHNQAKYSLVTLSIFLQHKSNTVFRHRVYDQLAQTGVIF